MEFRLTSSFSRILKSSNFRVIFSGMTVNVFYLAYGCSLSYPSPAVPNMNENANPFRVNDNEQSWIGSLAFLGNAVGSVVCGSLADALGRKLVMMLSALACVVGLTIVSAATNVQMVYVGLFVTGIFSDIANAAVSLYSSEISTEDNRGFIVSLGSTAEILGMVFVFAAGSYLSWNWLAIFTATFYALPILVVVFLPESPRWLLLKGNKEAAAHSLGWFRGEDADIDVEMKVIEDSLVDASKEMSAWKVLLQKQNAKPLFVCCFLFFVQSFSGNFVMAVFLVTLFQMANVNINPNLQSVVTGLFSLGGSLMCLFLIERWGRRPLLLFSTFFTALSMGLVAAFFKIHEFNPIYATQHLYWLPIMGLSLSNFMFYVGLLPVPWVFSCELFSTHVRGVTHNVLYVVSSLFCFAATKTFTDVQSAVNTSGALWLYTACGVVGFFFVVFFVKEPKHEIME